MWTMARAQPVFGLDIGLEAEHEAREQSLLLAAGRGDGRAFAALVHPHLGVMYRAAARCCGDASLAEDAVQEALSVASLELGRYRAGSSLRAWLATIAIRRAHTLARAERRRHAREQEAPPPNPAASPAELMGAALAARRVHQALAGMPDKRREAAILRWDAGLPYAEIAAAIDSTEASVRVLVHLAMKELRERLRDLVDAAEDLDREPSPEDAP